MGCNKHGQLGIGDRDSINQSSPTLISGLMTEQGTGFNVISIVCGLNHAAALTDNGEVYTWGLGSQGALGTGSREDAFDPILITEYLEDPIIQVSTGGNHTALLTMSGSLYLCGDNQYGQLGFSKQEETSTDQLIKIYDNVDKVSCGENHTLLLMKDGTLMSSGSNELFQLGRALPEGENESDGFEVIKAMRGINIKEISAWNMCASIAENKDLYIWGSLVNQKGMSVIIEEPELIPDTKFKTVEVGKGIIAGIEVGTQLLKMLNFNESSLENTAFFNEFKFNDIEDLSDKKIERFSLGKSDFIVAIGQLQQQSDILQNTVQLNKTRSKHSKELNQGNHPHDVSFSMEETKMKEMMRVSDFKSKGVLDEQTSQRNSLSPQYQNKDNELASQIALLKDMLSAKDQQMTEQTNRLETQEERFMSLTEALQEKETALDQAQIERQLLKQHIQSLEKIEQDHQESLKKIEKENIELQVRLKERDRIITEASERRAETLEQQLTEQMIKLQQVEQESERIHTEKDNHINDLMQKLFEAQKQVKDVNQEISDQLSNLKNTLNYKESQIETLQRQISSEKNQHELELQAAKKEIDSLKTQISQIEETLQMKDQEIATKDDLIMQASQTIDDLQNQITSREDQFKDHHQKLIRENEQQVQGLQSQIESLTNENLKLKEQVQSKSAEVNELQNLVNSNEQIKDKQANDLIKVVKELKEKLDLISNDNEKYINQINQMDVKSKQDIAKLEKDKKALLDQNELLQLQLQQQIEQTKSTNLQLELLQNQEQPSDKIPNSSEETNIELDKQKDKYEKLRQELLTLTQNSRTQITKLSQQITDLESLNTQLLTENQNLNDIIKGFEGLKEKHRQEIEVKDKQISDIKSKFLEDGGVEPPSFEVQNKSFMKEEQIATLQAKIEELETQNQKLSQKQEASFAPNISKEERIQPSEIDKERIEHLDRKLQGLMKFLEAERLKTFNLEKLLQEKSILDEEKLTRPFRIQIEELTSQNNFIKKELQELKARFHSKEQEMLKQIEEKEKLLSRKANQDPDESLLKMIRDRVRIQQNTQSQKVLPNTQTNQDDSFYQKKAYKIKKEEEGGKLNSQVEDLKKTFKLRKPLQEPDRKGPVYQSFQQAYNKALPIHQSTFDHDHKQTQDKRQEHPAIQTTSNTLSTEAHQHPTISLHTVTANSRQSDQIPAPHHNPTRNDSIPHHRRYDNWTQQYPLATSNNLDERPSVNRPVSPAFTNQNHMNEKYDKFEREMENRNQHSLHRDNSAREFRMLMHQVKEDCNERVKQLPINNSHSASQTLLRPVTAEYNGNGMRKDFSPLRTKNLIIEQPQSRASLPPSYYTALTSPQATLQVGQQQNPFSTIPSRPVEETRNHYERSSLYEQRTESQKTFFNQPQQHYRSGSLRQEPIPPQVDKTVKSIIQEGGSLIEGIRSKLQVLEKNKIDLQEKINRFEHKMQRMDYPMQQSYHHGGGRAQSSIRY